MNWDIFKEIAVAVAAVAGFLTLLWKSHVASTASTAASTAAGTASTVAEISSADVKERLNKQDIDLDFIKLQLTNHIPHQIKDIQSKVDGLPCLAPGGCATADTEPKGGTNV